MRKLIYTAIVAAFGLPAAAEDAAVLIGNDRYRTFDRLVGGSEIVNHLRQARDAGYEAEALRNGSASAMRGIMTEFEEESKTATRLVAALTGRFVTDGKRTWLMTVSAPQPTLFGIEREALSLESVLQVMEARPGESVLLLGYDEDSKERYSNDLREGIGALDIPQGVTVLRGAPDDISDFLTDSVLAAGENIMVAARRDKGIRLNGFAPRELVMQPTVVEDPTQSPSVTGPNVREQQMWDRAQSLDTLAGYETYLEVYPRGPNADAARKAIDAIKAEPNRADRVLEDRLGLTRAQRQEIQRDLSLLGYNTRGIDGIFGRGTRSAVSNWQQQNGFRQTGYLTDEQVVRIDAQATRRAAQIEEEAAREQAARDRRDRAYWEETGVSGREADLRNYLERFPDGLYSNAAENLLEQIEEEKAQTAARADRDAWRQARNTNTARSYRTYLNRFPQGAFRQEAEARLNALEQDGASQSDRDRAKAAEDALKLNRVTRQLAERKLERLGLEPGRVDGTFNNQTRRAIRRFQQSRGMPITGYLNQQAVVFLLVAQ